MTIATSVLIEEEDICRQEQDSSEGEEKEKKVMNIRNKNKKKCNDMKERIITNRK